MGQHRKDMEKSNSKIAKPITYKKIVSTKIYPEDRIKRVTQERCENNTLKINGYISYEKSFSQKTILKIVTMG